MSTQFDKSQLSKSQFLFSVVFFLQASALVTSFVSTLTKQDSWIVVLFGAIVCCGILWIYSSLMVMYPDKNLIQILEDVFGVVLGKVISVIYIWYFFTLTALNANDLGNFVKMTVMEQTPKLILMLICIAVAAYAVWHGLGVITRYSFVFVVFEFIIIGITIVLLINQVKLENFFPIMNLPVMKYVQGSHIISTIPFGDLIVFLMIKPNVKLTKRETIKCMYTGFLLGGVTLLFVIVRDIAILGNTLSMFTLPGLISIRLVNLGETLSRVEILFAVALIMLMFFRITILYYISVLALAQIFNMQSYKQLILIGGAFIVAYGLTLYPDSVKHLESAQKTEPIFLGTIEYLIPIVTLCLAKRKIKLNRGGVK